MPMRIAVLGYIVRGPVAGPVWHHLQYVLTLIRLGHEVLFVEDSEDYPSCFDPLRNCTDTDPTYGLAFIEKLFSRLNIPGQWAYYDAHTNHWHGRLGPAAADWCAQADVILNVSGVNPLRPWTINAPCRVLVDTDPVFTQVRHLSDEWFAQRSRQHNRFFTFGENLEKNGQPTCDVPDDGLQWLATRQPMCLDLWPADLQHQPSSPFRFTTVMQWDSYKVREYQGKKYGMKSQAFDPYLTFPAQLLQRFGEKNCPQMELAMTGTQAMTHLSSHGWTTVDALVRTTDPWLYQNYLRQSDAEWSIAKQGYASTGCGWFSERSCAYMATGRPVVIQDTGFSRWLQTGRGVLTFTTAQQALDAIATVMQDYPSHCLAARQIVEKYFNATTVVSHLLNRL